MGNFQPWITPVEIELSPKIDKKKGPLTPVLLPIVDQKPIDTKTSPPLATTSQTSIPTTQPFKANKNRPLRWLFLLSIILLASLMVQDALFFLQEQWKTHPFLGLFSSLIIMGLVVATLALTGREFIRLKQLRTLGFLRQKSLHLLDQKTFGNAMPLVDRIAHIYQDRKGMQDPLQTFHERLDDYLADEEVLCLFSTHVLSEVDTLAYRTVVKHASATALMTALSPLAWLDALFFLWRNLWMVREIAELYGARPGFAGSVVLLHQAARGMMMAGVTDLLTTGASQTLGDSVATAVMARAGQGIANGLFIARIGLQTMSYCRPIPFLDNEKPSLGRIRQEIQLALKNANLPEQQSNDE